MSANTVLRVVAPLSPFRNDAGGQPAGDASHCGYAGYALCWTWSGSAHLDFTRLPVNLTVARSGDSTIWAGSAVTFTAGMDPASVPGDSHPIVMAELQWRWIPDSTSSADTLGCGSASGGSCTRVLTTSGTMYAAAYVNGQQQQQAVHVDVQVPKLNVTALKTRLPVPGDSDTFTATGNGPTVIQGWNFTPDSAGAPRSSVAVGSAWGSCTASVSTCTNFVGQSGTVSVIGTVHGVQVTATAHVAVVVLTLTLDVDHATVNYGDTATFTPQYDGAPTPADRWRWAPDSAATDTTACASGVIACKKRMIASGMMWAYVGHDSANALASVVANRLALRAIPNHVTAVGGSVTFTASTEYPTTDWGVTGWLFIPDSTAMYSSPGCPQQSTAASCTDSINHTGTMRVYGHVPGTTVDSADARIYVGDAGNLKVDGPTKFDPGAGPITFRALASGAQTLDIVSWEFHTAAPIVANRIPCHAPLHHRECPRRVLCHNRQENPRSPSYQEPGA